jgi:hypothetical protein
MKILVLFLLLLGSFIDREVDTNGFADVMNVSASGIQGNYTFNVTIKSPDLGCDQYADWWEVVSTDGVLIYRRILAHSHVSEQPFTRPGGNVHISNDQVVLVRAHMNNTGYGGKVMVGSVKYGFQQKPHESGFAKSLEKEEPLPDGCTF